MVNVLEGRLARLNAHRILQDHHAEGARHLLACVSVLAVEGRCRLILESVDLGVGCLDIELEATSLRAVSLSVAAVVAFLGVEGLTGK